MEKLSSQRKGQPAEIRWARTVELALDVRPVQSHGGRNWDVTLWYGFPAYLLPWDKASWE